MVWDVLPVRLPWFVVGQGLGLLVVGLQAIANKPLGATGAYLQTMSLVTTRRSSEPWRVAYFVGLLAGGIIAALLQRGSSFRMDLDYGALGDAVPASALVLILFAAGLLMGYGARWMGGCTSGHGLCGVSALAVGSILATATFFTTAVATTFLIHWLTGGGGMIAIGLLFGIAFGFLLSAGGFTDYDTVHDSLLLRDANVFLVMGSAVLTAMPLLHLLRRRRWVTPLGGPLTITPSKVESKFVRGGLVFGVGFAVSGTCVAPAVAMIGTGHLAGLATVAGLFAGIALRDAYVARATATPTQPGHPLRTATASPEAATGTAIGM